MREVYVFQMMVAKKRGSSWENVRVKKPASKVIYYTFSPVHRRSCSKFWPPPEEMVTNFEAYLIFVISFTQAAFFNSKFYTRKLTKNTPKTLKNVPEKSNICSFCIQSGKCYTWQNIFTRAPPMVPVTIIRYGSIQDPGSRMASLESIQRRDAISTSTS